MEKKAAEKKAVEKKAVEQTADKVLPVRFRTGRTPAVRMSFTICKPEIVTLRMCLDN